jgi:hypothetical protein
MNMQQYRFATELIQKIDLLIDGLHGDVREQDRKQVAEFFREKARDAATSAAGERDDDDDPLDYAGLFEQKAKLFRAVADALDPRDEVETLTPTAKINKLMAELRGTAAGLFQRIGDPAYQAAAEASAKKIAEQANSEGFPVVVGTLIAAADMMERVSRLLKGDVF